MAERIINLDHQDDRETVVIIHFGGSMTPISRVRLLELLDREQKYLAALATGGKPSRTADGTGSKSEQSTAPATAILTGIITDRLNHRSLSNRIKKIYDYSTKQRTLRPNHTLHLREILEAFDWQVPDHPNTQLEFHLGEIGSWSTTTDSLKEQIATFLVQYKDVRYRNPA